MLILNCIQSHSLLDIQVKLNELIKDLDPNKFELVNYYIQECNSPYGEFWINLFTVIKEVEFNNKLTKDEKDFITDYFIGELDILNTHITSKLEESEILDTGYRIEDDPRNDISKKIEIILHKIQYL